MTSAYFNYFVKVDLTIRGYIDGATATATYSFVNKSPKDDSATYNLWPILVNVGEITRAAGDPLPSVSIGSFTIRNNIGSFGANRKFSDLFQRYTPIEQDVVIYLAEVANNADNVTGLWVQVAKGKCTAFQASVGDEPTLTFQVQGARMSEKIVTLDVDRAISGMTNAPDSSLGRTVPLVFGESNEVIPIRITADGSNAPQYAYGTAYYNHLKNSTASTPTVYTKNYEDYWEQIQNNFTDRYGGTSLGTYTLNTFDGQAHGLGDGFKNGLVTGVKLRAKGNGLASSTAYLTVFLLRYDPTTYTIVEQVAIGRQALSVYNAQNAASTNPIALNIAFDEPVFLSSYLSKYKYALGWKVTGYQVNDMSLHYDNTATDVLFTRSTSHANSNEWHVANTAAATLMYDLHMVTFTFTDHVAAYNTGGFTYSKLAITCDSVDSNQVVPPFDEVPILLGGVTGLSAYSGGAIRKSAADIVNDLAYTWGGTSWATSNEWDTSTNSTRLDLLYKATNGLAFADSVSLITGNDGGTWPPVVSGVLFAGYLGVIIIASDNTSTTDGDNSEVLSVTDSVGNTWLKAGEYTNSNGSAAAGATVSVWYCKAEYGLSSGDTITPTFSGSPTRKAMTGHVFICTGNPTVIVTGTRADDAADAGSITVTPPLTRQHLYIRATACESDNTSYTATGGYTAFTHTSSTTSAGGGAAANMGARGEFKIVSNASDTSDPTTSTADHASIMICIDDVPYTTFRHRQTAGVIDQRSTFSQVVSEICRGTASKVGIYANGKLFMHPWGFPLVPKYAIPAGDILPMSWNQLGIETVVNRIKVNTRRTYLYPARQDQNASAEGRIDSGYYYSTDFNSTDMPAVAIITQKSRANYGDRPGAEVNFTIFPISSTSEGTYLGGSTAHGSILAEYVLAKGIEPTIYATFVVPYHRYSNLEMFDVITFAHPDFPSFYGVSAEGEEPVYEDSNTGRTNLIDGYEWVRAETYRGQVEEITHLLPFDHAPALKITVRVITNPSIDVT